MPQWVEWEPETAIALERPVPTRKDTHGANCADEDNLYKILGVEPDAEPDQIKRQYFVLARKTHPDKNPDDEEAHERFQKISHAYQVLSNPGLRARYDAEGADALDEPYVDQCLFFTMLFGSDLFEDIIGELMVATATQNEMTELQMKREQIRRVHLLGLKLRERCEPLPINSNN